MKKEVKPLRIALDARSATPVYEQVKHAIKLAILSGYLSDGDQLVPVRDLAAQLTINVNTILKVYGQLENEGFVASLHGSGYFVCIAPSLRDKERGELFSRISAAYIRDAVSLGYSPREIIDILTLLIQNAGANGGEP